MIDPTQNRIPYGLMTRGEQAVLDAHGGPYEYWDRHYEGWVPHDGFSFVNGTVYRVKPGPKIETRTETRYVEIHSHTSDMYIHYRPAPGRIKGQMETTLHDDKPVKIVWEAYE